MATSGVVRTVSNVAKVMKGINLLVGTDVMVGVPSTKAGRREGPINNAALAYIHDKGAPAAHIPARPFMKPGIESVKDKVATELSKAGKLALKGKAASVQTVLNRVGIIASQAIKAKISEGIPPPLAQSTVKGRIRRVKGKKRRQKIAAALASGAAPSVQGGQAGLFTPLIVTGQLRNAITFVLRKAKFK
jgi:hypothetical protein